MGGRESTTRKSFGLDEEENVTVLQGIKLSDDVLHRMRDAPQGQPKPTSKPETSKPEPAPPRPPAAQPQEELRKRLEREQQLMREELALLATGQEGNLADGGDGAQSSDTQERADNLSKQLERKDAELKRLAAFYKEQLQLMEKTSIDCYQQASQTFSQAAVRAEAQIKPRPTTPICPELQAQVLRCYEENRKQTLHCSRLAKDYISCINTTQQNVHVSHG